MKKIAFSFLMIIVLSCSRTADNQQQPTNPTTTTILPKKVTDGSLVMNVSYDGTKINNIKRSDGVTVYYTYTGNLVTGIKFVDSSGNVVENDIYKYDVSENLSEINLGNIVKKYTKQPDGRILEVMTQNNTSSSSRYLTFNGGNLIKTESLTSNSTFLYDSKNSPFVNVIGLIKIFDNNGITINNLTEQNLSNLNGNTVISTSKFRNAISYNSNNYPTEIKIYHTGTNGVENFEKSLIYEY